MSPLILKRAPIGWNQDDFDAGGRRHRRPHLPDAARAARPAVDVGIERQREAAMPRSPSAGGRSERRAGALNLPCWLAPVVAEICLAARTTADTRNTAQAINPDPVS